MGDKDEVAHFKLSNVTEGAIVNNNTAQDLDITVGTELKYRKTINHYLKQGNGKKGLIRRSILHIRLSQVKASQKIFKAP